MQIGRACALADEVIHRILYYDCRTPIRVNVNP
jgi:hypothetical protein